MTNEVHKERLIIQKVVPKWENVVYINKSQTNDKGLSYIGIREFIMSLAVNEDISTSRPNRGKLPVHMGEGEILVVDLQELSFLRRREG